MIFILNENYIDVKMETDEYECEEYPSGGGGDSGFTTHHIMTKVIEKNIRPELEKLNLSIDIINTANNIFQQMQIGTRRNQKRRQLIFHCVRTAYDHHGIPKDPKELALICGIDYSEITKASSMCSPVQTNYSSPIVVYTPVQFINDVFKRFSDSIESTIEFPSDTIDHILDMAKEINKIIENDSKAGIENPLIDEKPQMVAAAIVLYYLEIHDISIERKQYAKLFNTTDMTINKLKKSVDTVYNRSN
jgi:transcription initiation factor TFIIIB Brf1 subunit/transcription initiation factor TFIIB